MIFRRATYRLHLASLACLSAAGVVLCGCTKTQLSAPDASAVTFTIEWPTTKADAATKTGTIYLYPVAGGEPIVVSGVQDKSAPINLPKGTYSIIVYNENLSVVQTRNPGSYDQFEAFLEPKAQTTKDQTVPVVPQADYLYLLSGNANRQIEVATGKSYGFKLSPSPATQTFRFVVTVKSTIEMAGVVASLTGVASRLNLSQAKPLSSDIYPVVVPFDFNATRAQNALAVGMVETFGVDPEHRTSGTNILHLEFVPKTATPNLQTSYSFDLTKEFDSYQQQNANLDILIEVGDPTPPDPPVPPDPPKPDDPVVLKITITVKPWIEEDGGHIDAIPA